jgi:GT2 family glycosyltransferase
MYISKKCLSDIGSLNDSFFMYNEDLEYCLRAKKNGYLLYYVPDSIIWHKIGASSGESNSSFSAYWIMRNRIKVSKIYGSWLTMFTTLLFIFISRIPMFFYWTFKNRLDLVSAQVKGLKDGLYLKIK